MQWLSAHALPLYHAVAPVVATMLLWFATRINTMSDEEKASTPAALLFLARVLSWRNPDGSWSIPGWPGQKSAGLPLPPPGTRHVDTVVTVDDRGKQ